MKTWTTKSGYKIIRVLGGRSNVFLLTNAKKNILIDTSVARNWPRLKRKLMQLGIHSIDYLILTHAHFDHAANASRIKEKYHPLVVIHRNEEPYMKEGDNIIPEGTTSLTRFIMNFAGRKLFNKFRYDPCMPDIVIDAYYDLKEAGFHAVIIHTPGHTSGSVSVIVDDEIAIAGDTFFGVFKGSVFPPYAENKDLMIKSWERLLQTGCSLFLPSHGSANSRAMVEAAYTKRITN